MGVIEPNEEEAAAMAEELAAMKQEPDPQAELAKGLTMEAQAKASKAMADTEASLANAEKSRAQTIEILSKISEAELVTGLGVAQEIRPPSQPAPPMAQPQQAAPPPAEQGSI
jgi:hypothetical protein